MRQPEGLWLALESVPGLALTDGEWREQLGGDFDVAERYLRPTDNLAKSLPCPKGCLRRVVIHGPEDIVAVCGNDPKECDLISLDRRDIIVTELSLRALLADVSTALGIRQSSVLEELEHGTWSVGIWRSENQPELPVYLAIPLPEDGLRRSVTTLLAGTTGPFILLAPTCRLDMSSFGLLRRRECSLVALQDVMTADEQGVLQARESLESFLATDRAPINRADNVFKRAGEGWMIRFGGSDDAHFGNLKGLSYLAVILHHPGREFEPWEIANEAGDSPLYDLSAGAASRSRRALLDEGIVPDGGLQASAGPDSKALSQCRQRLHELGEDLAEAEVNHDVGRVQALRDQREQILEYLSHRRPQSGPEKKERDRVNKSLAYSLDKIQRQLPELSSHLRDALQTGRHWCYRRKLAVPWEL